MNPRRAMASRRSGVANARLRRLRELARRTDARLIALAAMGAVLILAMGLHAWLDAPEPGEPLAVDAPAAPVPAPPSPESAGEAPPAGDRPAAEPPAGPIPEPPPEHDWNYVQVARGDTLERIFRRLGLSARELHEVVHVDERTRELADLRPGDELAFELDDEGGLLALRAESGDEHWLIVERGADGLSSRLVPRDLEVRVVEVETEIVSSLFNAGKNAGLTDNMILRLAGIFGWDIDFALDIRKGDRFAMVFEEVYRDGQFLRQGSILGATFVNRGETFHAVRFDDGDGPDYYDPEGRPMRKAFLRAPLNFTRVTSNFNPRRFHPVTRRVRPHNGTDYGADVGTPIWASGDGTVIESSYNGLNGHYVFIKHGNHIVTRYLHLSKRLVNRGDRVRQGQTIGLSGATGRVTGPHLHYEFLVHGRHRDPRKVDLPEAEPLPETVMDDFRIHAEPMIDRLERLLPPEVLLASAGGECEDDRDC